MAGNESLVALNDREVRLASFYEQTFWTHGSLPTDEVAAQATKEKIPYIQECFKKHGFRTYLVSRGVNLQQENDGLLTAQQLLLANVILNAHDKRTIREKLAMVGISSQQYHAWMKQPAFSDYVAKRAKDMFSSSDWQMYQSLSDVAGDGDVGALKLYFEMRGIHNPRVDINVNLDVVLGQIVEVVSKHVDPETMQRISRDIERVLEGEPVDMRPSVAIEANSLPVGIQF